MGGDVLSFDEHFCYDLTRTTRADTDVPIFYVVVAVPTFLFFLYLVLHLRGSLRKLRESESLIMSTYYGFVWGVLTFNVVRIVLNIILESWDLYGTAYDIIFVIINFVLMFVEVSVLILMSENYTISGREALPKAVWISVLVALIYATVQAILLFVFDVHLYTADGRSRSVHIYWFVLECILTGAYVLILLLGLIVPLLWRRRSEGTNHDGFCFNCLHHVWRFVNFPVFTSRPQFYYYVAFLIFFNGIKALGSLIAYEGVDAGHCLDYFGNLSYYCFYIPLLYWAFLRGFFRDPSLSEHYSEMMVSGYFDSDT